MMEGHVYQRESDAELDLRWWQRVLRLQDWDIRLRIAREREFEQRGRSAEVHIDVESKRAVVLLLDPQDYPEHDLWPQDHERSLVHELVHLHVEPFAPDNRDGLEVTAMEQAINALADALVSLRRRAAGKEA